MNSEATSVQIGPFLITPWRCLICEFVVLLLVCVMGLVLCDYGLTKIKWTAGDWTLVSCLVLTIVATWSGRDLGEKFENAVTRLWQRGVLVDTDSDQTISHNLMTETVQRIQATANRSAIAGSIAIGLIVAIMVGVGETLQFSGFQGIYDTVWNLSGLVVYVMIGVVAGLIMGRASVYSLLANILGQNQIGIKVMPGHPDRAAGLKPVGDLFMRQAFLAMLPALFVGAWYLLIAFSPKFSPSDSYFWKPLQDNYRGLFFVFFFVFLVLEILGFILPMMLFHLEMKRQKTELQKSADQLSIRITDLNRQVYDTTNQDEIVAIQSELDCLNKRHDEIELLPTWPVNWAMWMKFAIGNLCLAVPVVAKLVVKLYMSIPEKF